MPGRSQEIRILLRESDDLLACLGVILRASEVSTAQLRLGGDAQTSENHYKDLEQDFSEICHAIDQLVARGLCLVLDASDVQLEAAVTRLETQRESTRHQLCLLRRQLHARLSADSTGARDLVTRHLWPPRRTSDEDVSLSSALRSRDPLDLSGSDLDASSDLSGIFGSDILSVNQSFERGTSSDTPGSLSPVSEEEEGTVELEEEDRPAFFGEFSVREEDLPDELPDLPVRGRAHSSSASPEFRDESPPPVAERGTRSLEDLPGYCLRLSDESLSESSSDSSLSSPPSSPRSSDSSEPFYGGGLRSHRSVGDLATLLEFAQDSDGSNDTVEYSDKSEKSENGTVEISEGNRSSGSEGLLEEDVWEEEGEEQEERVELGRRDWFESGKDDEGPRELTEEEEADLFGGDDFFVALSGRSDPGQSSSLDIITEEEEEQELGGNFFAEREQPQEELSFGTKLQPGLSLSQRNSSHLDANARDQEHLFLQDSSFGARKESSSLFSSSNFSFETSSSSRSNQEDNSSFDILYKNSRQFLRESFDSPDSRPSVRESVDTSDICNSDPFKTLFSSAVSPERSTVYQTGDFEHRQLSADESLYLAEKDTSSDLVASSIGKDTRNFASANSETFSPTLFDFPSDMDCPEGPTAKTNGTKRGSPPPVSVSERDGSVSATSTVATPLTPPKRRRLELPLSPVLRRRQQYTGSSLESSVSSTPSDSPLMGARGQHHRKPNDLWSAIQTDYNSLMEDTLIQACRSTESTSEQGLSSVSFTEFVHQYRELSDWLSQLHHALRRQGASRCERYLNQSYHDELLSRSNRKRVLTDCARQLVHRYPAVKDEVSQRLQSLQRQWDSVEQLAAPGRLGHSPETMLKDLAEDMCSLREWLHVVESRLLPLCLRAELSEAQLRSLLQEHQTLQREIEARSKFVSAVLRLCSQLQADERCGSARERETLRSTAAGLEKRWHAIWLQALERQYMLEEAIAKGGLRITQAGSDYSPRYSPLPVGPRYSELGIGTSGTEYSGSQPSIPTHDSQDSLSLLESEEEEEGQSLFSAELDLEFELAAAKIAASDQFLDSEGRFGDLDESLLSGSEFDTLPFAPYEYEKIVEPSEPAKSDVGSQSSHEPVHGRKGKLDEEEEDQGIGTFPSQEFEAVIKSGLMDRRTDGGYSSEGLGSSEDAGSGRIVLAATPAPDDETMTSTRTVTTSGGMKREVMTTRQTSREERGGGRRMEMRYSMTSAYDTASDPEVAALQLQQSGGGVVGQQQQQSHYRLTSVDDSDPELKALIAAGASASTSSRHYSHQSSRESHASSSSMTEEGGAVFTTEQHVEIQRQQAREAHVTEHVEVMEHVEEYEVEGEEEMVVEANPEAEDNELKSIVTSILVPGNSSGGSSGEEANQGDGELKNMIDSLLSREEEEDVTTITTVTTTSTQEQQQQEASAEASPQPPQQGSAGEEEAGAIRAVMAAGSSARQRRERQVNKRVKKRKQKSKIPALVTKTSTTSTPGGRGDYSTTSEGNESLVSARGYSPEASDSEPVSTVQEEGRSSSSSVTELYQRSNRLDIAQFMDTKQQQQQQREGSWPSGSTGGAVTTSVTVTSRRAASETGATGVDTTDARGGSSVRETGDVSEDARSSAFSETAWDNYQAPPYTLEGCTELEPKLEWQNEDDLDLEGTPADIEAELKRMRLLQERAKARHRVMGSGKQQQEDSDSDADDLANVVRESRRQLRWVTRLLEKQRLDPRTMVAAEASSHSEIAATCQTNVCCLRVISDQLTSGTAPPGITDADSRRINELLVEWTQLELVAHQQHEVGVSLTQLQSEIDLIAGSCGKSLTSVKDAENDEESLQTGLLEVQRRHTEAVARQQQLDLLTQRLSSLRQSVTGLDVSYMQQQLVDLRLQLKQDVDGLQEQLVQYRRRLASWRELRTMLQDLRLVLQAERSQLHDLAEAGGRLSDASSSAYSSADETEGIRKDLTSLRAAVASHEARMAQLAKHAAKLTSDSSQATRESIQGEMTHLRTEVTMLQKQTARLLEDIAAREREAAERRRGVHAKKMEVEREVVEVKAVAKKEKKKKMVSKGVGADLARAEEEAAVAAPLVAAVPAVKPCWWWRILRLALPLSLLLLLLLGLMALLPSSDCYFTELFYPTLTYDRSPPT